MGGGIDVYHLRRRAIGRHQLRVLTHARGKGGCSVLRAEVETEKAGNQGQRESALHTRAGG